MKDNIFIACAVLIAIGAGWFFLNWLADSLEISECKEWTVNAANLNNYYFTQWQADQCAAHGIKVNAPIK